MVPGGKYDDPVSDAIYGLPFNLKRRSWLAKKWYQVRPERYWRIVWWYERHDTSVILLLWILVTVTPIAMMHYGIGFGYVFAFVTVGIFVVVKVDRYRERQEREVAKEAAKSEATDEWLRDQNKPPFTY